MNAEQTGNTDVNLDRCTAQLHGGWIVTDPVTKERLLQIKLGSHNDMLIYRKLAPQAIDVIQLLRLAPPWLKRVPLIDFDELTKAAESLPALEKRPDNDEDGYVDFALVNQWDGSEAVIRVRMFAEDIKVKDGENHV